MTVTSVLLCVCTQCLRHTSGNDEYLLCSLVFGEMSIRKHVQWNGTENEGYVDLGTHVDGDSIPLATEVLMFIVTPLNAVWKLPIAYFFIDGLSSDVKCSLVTEAIERLYLVNVRVTSIVCDGPATNFSVGAKLGASLSAENMQPYFSHPHQPEWKIYFIFDAAHMLKLMRNTLADKSILVDADGRQVRWQYVKDLYELQNTEGLKAANKLRRAHVEWFTQKMKVSLAAQTLSRSVASALEFVSKDLQMTKFADAEATVHFIKVVDQLFDVLNSRSPLASEFKSVMKTSNDMFWRPFLAEAEQYLRGLQVSGIPLHQSPRKTAVLGFLATIKSVIGLYDDLVPSGQLKYLATYRLSQDHIELTFSVIRSRGRWNNNPTTGQFRAAYKQLLMKQSVKPSRTGNAVAQDASVLMPSVAVVDSPQSVVSTDADLKCYGLDTDGSSGDHNYTVTVERITLTEFSSNIVAYIAGFVARKLCQKLKCVACKLSLLSSTKIAENCKLIQRKDSGGLVFPSHSVLVVCRTAEQCLRFACGCRNRTRQRNLRLAVQVAVIQRVQHLELFTNTEEEHTCQSDLLELRVVTLIRVVVTEFLTTRLHAMAKRTTELIKGRNVRFNSNKQVLFSHQ